MRKISFVHYTTKIIVDILLYAGVVSFILIPFCTEFIAKNYLYTDRITALMILFFISGAAVIYILFNLKKMLKTLLYSNPFVRENVTCFRKISVACAVIAIAYFIKLFYMFSVGTVLITVIFIIGCLFCLTLKDLFKEAIYYKEEIELTV